MSRPKGGMGRGLGALGLGTGLRNPEANAITPEADDVTESVPVNLEVEAEPKAANGASAVPVEPREVTTRDGRKIGLTQVPISSIIPNPYQPRKHMDPVVLDELAASILEHGLIQPPVVSYNPDYNQNVEEDDTDPAHKNRKARYVLIAGERRWTAAKIAGLTTIPVVIKETTPLQMLELALVENIQRADLNPLEEAYAYRQLVSEFGLTQESVAKKVGKSRVAVTNSLRLLSLPPAVIEAINHGDITEGHARAILMLDRLSDEQRLRSQQRLLHEIILKQLTVRDSEEAARRLLRMNLIADIDAELQGALPAQEPPKPVRVTDRETHELEERLIQTLETKVELMRSKKGGKIVIQFFSDEELEKILGKIIDFEI